MRNGSGQKKNEGGHVKPFRRRYCWFYKKSSHSEDLGAM